MCFDFFDGFVYVFYFFLKMKVVGLDIMIWVVGFG